MNDCFVVSLNDNIKKEYIELRKKYHLKLADAIIAAITLNIPLITSNKQL